MSDESKATVVLALWSMTFHAGLYVAAVKNKAVGLILAVTATVILVVYLRADARVDAEKRRRRHYQADADKRAREALRHDNC